LEAGFDIRKIQVLMGHSRLSTIDSVKRIAYESRVFFFNTKGRKSSVPLHWTDIGPADPFVVVSAGRSLFRVEDLLGLVRIIEEICSASRK
jgi:hypothetical protein